MRTSIAALILTAVLPLPARAVQAPLEVDHVFLAVSRDAPEAAALASAGFLVLPDTTVHEGQGTASIVTVFENAYIELVWVEDPATDRLDMASRVAWRTTGVSPIGVGLRRVDTLSTALPFRTRSHVAAWMLPGTTIEIATNETNPEEPVLFVVPPYMSVPVMMGQRGTPPPQPIGVHRLTRVRIGYPAVPTRSEAAEALQKSGVIEFEAAAQQVLDLEFDQGGQGREIDFRPRLPLVVHY